MENETQETQENQEPQVGQNELSQPEDLEAIKAQLEGEAQARAALEQAAADKDGRIAELEAALEAILDLCAPLSRRTAGDDEAWEAAIRQGRAALARGETG